MTVAIFVLMLMFGVSVTSAKQLVHDDGRLNQVAHFGGDAVYCVDAGGSTTNAAGDFAGFVVLNSSGQPVLEVALEDVDAASAVAEPGGAGVLVASGDGSHGPIMLYLYKTAGGSDVFSYFGYDEHGKANTFEFSLCTPVGPAPFVPGAKKEDCPESVQGAVGDSGPPGPTGKLLAFIPVTQDDPCVDDCLSTPFPFKRLALIADADPCEPDHDCEPQYAKRLAGVQNHPCEPDPCEQFVTKVLAKVESTVQC